MGRESKGPSLSTSPQGPSKGILRNAGAFSRHVADGPGSTTPVRESRVTKATDGEAVELTDKTKLKFLKREIMKEL